MLHQRRARLAREPLDNFGREPTVDSKTVAAVDVDPRVVGGGFGIHAEIDDEVRELQHRPENAPASRRTDAKPWPPVARHHDRTHIGQCAFAGPDRVRPAGARVEPHHAVVHQDAGAGQHIAAAERRQERRRQCRYAALTVDGGNMRGRCPRTGFDIPHCVEPLGISSPERLDERFEVIAIACAGEFPSAEGSKNTGERRSGCHPGGRLERHAAIGDFERRHDTCATARQILD